MMDLNYNITQTFYNTTRLYFDGDIPNDCLVEGNQYSARCIYEWFCPQMPQYFIKLGITIIIVYILWTWAMYYFNRSWGEKLGPYINNLNGTDLELIPKILGDLTNPMTRLWLTDWIRQRFVVVFIILTMMVIYFNMGLT